MTDQPVRTTLLDSELAVPAPVTTARIDRVELAPGQAPGLHRHPCDVVGYVVGGTIRYQLAGGDVRRLRAGDAFLEPAGARVLQFDNDSADEPAVFLACYLLPAGETQLIEML